MLPNISFIVQACQELGLKYSFKDKNKNYLVVKAGPKNITFLNNSTTFNDETVAKICKDKSFTYQLLNPYLKMPKTLEYLDPNVSVEFQNYVVQKSNDHIAGDISSNFNFPVILKPNKKSQGLNVFKCQDLNQVSTSINVIFNKKSSGYDYLLLAQEFIEIVSEYRVIIFNKKVVLIYLKDISGAKFSGNLSPLHWEGSKAKYSDDNNLQDKIQTFINPIFEHLDLVYAGLDIAVDNQNKMWLIELNSQPVFRKFVEKNDSQIVVNIFKKILVSYV